MPSIDLWGGNIYCHWLSLKFLGFERFLYFTAVLKSARLITFPANVPLLLQANRQYAVTLH